MTTNRTDSTKQQRKTAFCYAATYRRNTTFVVSMSHCHRGTLGVRSFSQRKVI